MTVGLLLGAGGLAAGVFGSLLGLGGGILVVPLLTVAFGVQFQVAVGTSLVCVIVTSSAAAGVYLERRVANLRLGMLLELFTASGALVGGLVAFMLPDRVLAGLFAALLVYTAWSMSRRRATGPGDAELPADDPPVETSPESAFRAALHGPGYRTDRLGTGMAGSIGAGLVSALLGVGGGIVKVPLMHLVMGVPLRVATATSNMMIGVTAAASAVIYLLRGGIDPYVAGPTAIGVFCGALLGARLAPRIDVRYLRYLFVGVLTLTAVEMIARAVGA